MRIVFILFCAVAMFVVGMYVTDRSMTFGDLFDKGYYINRYWAVNMSLQDRNEIKKAILDKLRYDEDSPDLTDTDLLIRFTNYLNRIDSQYAAGTVNEKTKPGGSRWVAVRSLATEDKWLIPYIGNGLPDCNDVGKYSFPPDITTCVTPSD